jgi:hypothetical protein
MSNQALACQTPLEDLLHSVAAMLEHNEFEAAEALLHVIVKRSPHNADARSMLDAIKPAPAKKHYVDYDHRTGMFAVYDGNDKCVKIFASLEMAKMYARRKG